MNPLFIYKSIASQKNNNGKSLQWEKVLKNNIQEEQNWQSVKDSPPIFVEDKSLKFSNRDLEIKAIGRAVTVNGNIYPEISNYVPNAYVEDWRKTFTLSVRAISQTRGCSQGNFSDQCSDGVLDIDYNLINKENFSFNTRFNIQSLSNRGTSVGEGSSIGFKLSKKLLNSYSFSIGGENIIHLDDSIDLGRNFYIISSFEHKLNDKKNPAILFVNAGIGSDFFGYRGNGILGKTSCLGKPTLTGNGSNECYWGPIGSIALALNDRVAIVNEWFGYGYGTGLSLKPFKQNPILFSIYATDYIKGFPKYAQKSCVNNNCHTRFYGSLSVSF